MQTRAATRQSVAAAKWADLPPPLWDAIAEQLPPQDIMSLRQAWRCSSQLASHRVCKEVFARMEAQLHRCNVLTRSAAIQTVTLGMPMMLQQADGPNVAYLSGFLDGAADVVGIGGGCRFELVNQMPFVPGAASYRCTYALEPRHTDVLMQVIQEACGSFMTATHQLPTKTWTPLTSPAALRLLRLLRLLLSQYCTRALPPCRSSPPYLLQVVITFTEPTFPEGGTAAVDLEELRFVTPDGSPLVEYGLAFALDNMRCSTRAIRLSDGTGFGRLQGRSLADAPAHFAALRAAAEQQPLRTTEGRWSDGLLLPAIHGAVTRRYPVQL